MGQRLVVDIDTNGKTIATVYFHWSAYFFDAWYTLQKLAHILKDEPAKARILRSSDKPAPVDHGSKNHDLCLQDLETDTGVLKQVIDPRLKLIRGLEMLGGGLGPQDAAAAAKLYPGQTFRTDISRNDGLVCISDAEMEEARGWADGTATLDLDDETVTNDCFYTIIAPDGAKLDDIEYGDMLDDFADDNGRFVAAKCPTLPGDAFTFSFDGLDQFLTDVDAGKYDSPVFRIQGTDEIIILN